MRRGYLCRPLPCSRRSTAVFRFKIGMIPVLAACSAAGVLLYLLAGVTA